MKFLWRRKFRNPSIISKSILTNQIGNMTLFPKSNNYYMGDNIPGKPRQTVFFLGGFPMYREQCEAAFDGLNAFEVA